MVEFALHDFLELELDGLDGTDIGCAIIFGQSVDVELAIMDVSNIIVFQVQDLLGVLNKGLMRPKRGRIRQAEACHRPKGKLETGIGGGEICLEEQAGCLGA